MINYIKQSSKIKEIYMDVSTFNKIIERFKIELITNKDVFFELYGIDIKKCSQITNFENIINLLETYKNERIVERKEKEITVASYYGNPYITINLCMQSLLQKKSILALIEDNMFAVNKLLISIFNKVLENYKICKMINIYNLADIEELREIEKYVDDIICIGNTNTYYKYKKNGINKLQYIPFKNLAIYCDDDKYLELQYELYKFAINIGIETEIYEDDFDDFIECINLDNKVENVVIFSKSEKIIENAKNKIKNCKLYINENPFKDEHFKVLV